MVLHRVNMATAAAILVTLFVAVVDVAVSLEPRHVSVNCTREGVVVAIDKRHLPIETNAADFHLMDRRCVAHDNGTHVVAETSLSNCLCGQSYEASGVAYSNVLFSTPDPFAPRSPHASSCPKLSVSFKCLQPYDKVRVPRNTEKRVSCKQVVGIGPVLDRGILSSIGTPGRVVKQSLPCLNCTMEIGTGPALVDAVLSRVLSGGMSSFVGRIKQEVCKNLNASGEFPTTMSVYSDEEYLQPIGNTVFGGRDTPHIYYELNLNTGDPELEVFPTRCYATPDGNSDNLVQYVFIQEGCIVDSTVQFFPSSLQTKRFSIQSFHFVGSLSQSFFVHCDTVICDSKDPTSRCAQGCIPDDTNTRRKRGHSKGVHDQINMAVTLVCSRSRMIVTLDKSKLQDLLPFSSVHLNRKTCTATDNGTHLFLDVSQGECGTIMTNANRGKSRRNMLHFYSDLTRHLLLHPLVCPSARPVARTGRMRIARPHMVPKRSFYITTTKSAWVLTRIVSDGGVSERHATSVVHTKVTQRDGVLKIVNKIAFDDVTIRSTHCSISNSPILKKHVTLLRHGCSRHPSLDYKHSPTMEVLKIRLSQMSWPLTYVKCTIRACDAFDPISTCNSFDTCSDASAVAPASRQRRQTTPKSDRLSMHCGSRVMEILLPKTLLPQDINPTNLRLDNTSCTAIDLGSHIAFRTPLTSCGTLSSSSNGNMEFYNQISEVFTASDNVIMRRQPYELPFRCFYVTHQPTMETTFRLNNGVVKFNSKGVGSYSVLIKMFTGPDFTAERLAPFTALGIERDMYFEVGIVDSELDLGLFLDECYGAPVNAKSRDEKYTFIKNGCKLDPSVIFYDSGVPHRIHFSVKPFRFQRSGSDVLYVNCMVSACDAELPNTKCTRGCQG